MRRILSAVAVLAVLAGCGGGGGGGAAGPRLTNARLSYTALASFQDFCRAAGFDTGYVFDADFSGDVVGGTLNLAATFKPTGASTNLEGPIPSPDGVSLVVVGGDALEYRDCIRIGTEKTLSVEAWVVSAEGVEGNHVTASLKLQ